MNRLKSWYRRWILNDIEYYKTADRVLTKEQAKSITTAGLEEEK